MKKFCLSLALVLSTLGVQQAMGSESSQPLTAAEVDHLINGASDAKLLACIVAYDFEFVTQILGLNVEVTPNTASQSSQPDQQKDESFANQTRFDQMRKFMRTGRLTRSENARYLKLKVSKDAQVHCQVLAETAMEIFALKLQLEFQLQLQPVDDNSKRAPQGHSI